MGKDVPRRVRVALAALDLPPDGRVLEVGFGSGVALDLLCRLVPEGHVTGIDRSGTAVERASRRNAAHLAEARLDLVEGELARYRPSGDPFDAVLAVNVNVFWTGPADEELDRLTELLAEDGVVHLVYELPPGSPPETAERIEREVRGTLGRHGFTVETRALRPDGSPEPGGSTSDLVHLTARRAAPGR